MARSFLDSIADSASPHNERLWKIADKVDQVSSQAASLATIFSSPELDQICSRIGADLCPFKETEPFTDCSVYLVTGLAPSGGHTRVLRDLVRADQARTKVVLISRVLDTAHVPGFEPLFEGLDVEFRLAPPGPDLVGKTKWVQQQLAGLRPSTATMLLHSFDVVHTAAVQPQLMGRLFYVHNVDHSIALGLHLPHACHLDFHAKGLWQCKTVERVPDPHLIPLVADDLGHRRERPFLARCHLTTASSGGSEKFSLERFGSNVRYGLDYVDGVAAILAASRGTHLHFGRLSPDTMLQIRLRLDQLGLPRDRFQQWNYVPSVWAALLDHAVDVYVGSFPLGGGRATVEAMGAALPLIIHSNYWSNFLSVECEVYPGAMLWRTYEQLSSVVNSLTEASLRDHSRRARTYYEGHHTPDRLPEALARARSGATQDLHRPVYQPDLFRRFLDEHPELDASDPPTRPNQDIEAEQ